MADDPIPGLAQMAQMPEGVDPKNWAGPGGAYDEAARLAENAGLAAWSNRNTSMPFEPPPELAKYFGAYNQPRIDAPGTVAGEGGISLAQLAGSLAPHYNKATGMPGYDYPSDQGGFFRIQDVYGQRGNMSPQGGGPPAGGGDYIDAPWNRGGWANALGAPPRMMSAEAHAPSTNNWRLLGQGPGWIMRNGRLIDVAQSRMGGPRGYSPSGGNSGEQSMLMSYTPIGAGAGFGVPSMLQAGLGQPVTYGWPGAVSWNNAGMTSEG